MRRLAATLVLIVALLPLPAGAHSDSVKRNKDAICKAFGSFCGQALRVSWCESRWHTYARNGQYLGLFQMGSWERRTYGHHPSQPLVQARAAYRYFVASGRDWSPWECKP